MTQVESEDMYLMISADYVPSWGRWEGVRELVQNWYDGILQSFKTSTTIEKSRLTFEKVSDIVYGLPYRAIVVVI